jgi:hypothetical protein
VPAIAAVVLKAATPEVGRTTAALIAPKVAAVITVAARAAARRLRVLCLSIFMVVTSCLRLSEILKDSLNTHLGRKRLHMTVKTIRNAGLQ